MRAKNSSPSSSNRSGASARVPWRARPVWGEMHSSSVRSGARPAGGEQVDRADLLHPKLPPRTLVGQRGVHEAVQQHQSARVEQGEQPLLHELGARRRVQQRLGLRRDRQCGVLHKLADALRERDAAGLAQQLDGAPARGDLAREPLRERGLARAVETLDRDQQAPRHRGSIASTMGHVSLPGLDGHPHAQALLLPVLPRDGERPAREPAHAYLFHGPHGAGKRTVARALAAALLAEGARAPEAVAGRVARDAHPDLTWVTPSGAGEMLVADIDQAVVAAAAHTPFESRRRVFVIEDAHTLNDQAANRLLKTLEEPPPFAHLVLLAPSPREVLPTIASRCQLVRFDPLPSARIEERLTADREAVVG